MEGHKNIIVLKVVLQWNDIYFGNIRKLSMISGLKTEGSLRMGTSY